MNLKNKNIIITGGATRIGAAIAKKLSGKGVEIVIHFNKSKTKAEILKKELSQNSEKVPTLSGPDSTQEINQTTQSRWSS